MAERLYKTVSIAHSGCQDYSMDEPSFAAFNLGPAPDGKSGIVTVYRPAPVIAASKDMFTKQPFVLTHDGGMVTPENYQELVRGQTGDTATLQWTDDKEVTIVTPLTIMDAEAIDQYESGIREVSPGYGGEFHWQDGESANGEKYDIVMDRVTWVNHVALVPKGRGGDTAAILDSKGVKSMKKRSPKTGLIHSALRSVGLIADSSPDKFRKKINRLIRDRAIMDDDAMEDKTEEIKKIVASLPDSNEKEMLIRLIDDLPLTKGQPEEVAQKAGETVSDMYDNLDEKAMGEMKAAEKEKSSVVDDDDDAVKDDDEAGDVVAKEAPLDTKGGESVEGANATGSPKVVPGGTGTAVIDLDETSEKHPSEWSPEEVHAVMGWLMKAKPIIEKLMAEEAQEPEHEDISGELASGGKEANDGEEPFPTETGEKAVKDDDDKSIKDDDDDKKAVKDDDKKVIGDSMSYFASAYKKPDKKMGAVAALIHNVK